MRVSGRTPSRRSSKAIRLGLRPECAMATIRSSTVAGIIWFGIRGLRLSRGLSTFPWGLSSPLHRRVGFGYAR